MTTTGSNATLTIGGQTVKLKELSMVSAPVFHPWYYGAKQGTILDWQSAGPRPPLGRVFVDGLERTYIRRCKLGAFGWAEQLVRDVNNRPVRDRKGRIKTRIVYGVVAFKPLKPVML